MVDCVNEKVSKYLADLPSCDQMSYGDAKSSRSNSPTAARQRSCDGQIPTRLVTKIATSVAHNPLQFVAAKTNATALSEQAKQQLQLVDEQKKLRSEALHMTVRNLCIVILDFVFARMKFWGTKKLRYD